MINDDEAVVGLKQQVDSTGNALITNAGIVTLIAITAKSWRLVCSDYVCFQWVSLQEE